VDPVHLIAGGGRARDVALRAIYETIAIESGRVRRETGAV
jgi:hypothetical protein